jgi:hypothetical protein
VLNLKSLAVSFCLLGPVLPGALFAADYFVASQGNDASTGTSQQTPWRSVARANSTSFRHGDRLLFHGGQSFPGNLALRCATNDSTSVPLIISSYDAGRATILAGSNTGITVESLGGITISNLIVLGDGPTNNAGYGILCDNQLDGFQRLENLRIDNADTSGFGMFGVLISGKSAGFDHVQVLNCDLHDNLRGGMEIAGRLPYDSPLYAHADVVVRNCRAFRNSGDPHYEKNHSGSGMVLYQVDGGFIDGCSAWGNGELCQHPNGGVGIWSCASRAVTIQHCQSFANRTHGGDGGGFDLDGGSVDCVLQYNYSHDNDGPGLMLYTYRYSSYSDQGNIVRFNVSDGDSRRSKTYAGLWVRSDGGKMTRLKIYNNTIRIGRWSNQAAYVQGANVEAEFANNIFVGRDGALPLLVAQPENQLRFLNNLYWRAGAPFQIQWNGHVFTTLADWRQATGEEISFGKFLGLVTDPSFSTSSDLAAFTPRKHSPLLTQGIPLDASLASDLFGHTLKTAYWPLGAIGQGTRSLPR